MFLLVPLVWTSGPADPFVAVKVLLLTLGAAALASWRAGEVLDWGRALTRNAGDLRVTLLFGWALVSAVVNFSSAPGLRTVAGALPFLALFAILRVSPAARAAAIHASLAAGAISAIVGLMQWLHVPFFLLGTGEEPIGLLGNRNHLAVWLAMLLPLLAWRPPEEELTAGWPDQRAVTVGTGLLMALVLALTSCRGAMLALVASSYVLLATRPTLPRSRGLAAGVALAVGVAVAIGIWAPTPTARARTFTWSLAARAALSRPAVGYGPGSFGNTFASLQEVHFRGLDSDAARLARDDWQFTRNHRQAHNDWLQAIFEMGFPFGFLLLFLAVEVLRSAPVQPAATAAAVGLGVAGLTSLPMQTPATALLATAVAALALPGWIGNPRTQLDEEWPLWPKAWLAVLALLMAIHGCMDYLSSANQGAGARFFAAGRLDDADKALKRSLFQQPSNGVASELLGRVFEATGRKEAALALFDQAAALHLDAAAVVNRAVVLREMGRKDEAMAGFRRAVAMLPSDSDAWYFLGLALDETSRPGPAGEAFERAKLLRVENFKTYLEAARLALRRGDARRAEGLFRENVTYLLARMSEEDPTLATVDPVKRDFLALNADELDRLLAAPGRERDRDALRHEIARLFPKPAPGARGTP
ncbi:MAG: tetratricopeptide repeat protein [Candidatus Wallbacteria bacterium]|nr:tetratricopeptide repeat protein [Candidatus Wallbacteria bacterium]